MVLFQEAETLRLLELYAALRANPLNVTHSGIMLRLHAREELTAALNASFPRGQPWTESQVSVKFKNLRSEYAEFKWLSAQPGFRADGAGLMDAWWRDVKRVRPKSHTFKGKLPWVFEPKMRLIVGDSGAADGQQPERERGQVVVEVEAEAGDREEREEEAERQELQTHQEEEGQAAEQSSAAAASAGEGEASPHKQQRKRKREDEEREAASPPRTNADWDRSGARGYERGERGDYGQSLARSVEQSSAAAAGMARGFQDLVAMFQDESARCRALEQQSAQDGREHPSLGDQRSVLLAIANSLEHSTRATADVAKGYRELVSAFVRAADTERQQ